MATPIHHHALSIGSLLLAGSLFTIECTSSDTPAAPAEVVTEAGIPVPDGGGPPSPAEAAPPAPPVADAGQDAQPPIVSSNACAGLAHIELGNGCHSIPTVTVTFTYAATVSADRSVAVAVSAQQGVNETAMTDMTCSPGHESCAPLVTAVAYPGITGTAGVLYFSLDDDDLTITYHYTTLGCMTPAGTTVPPTAEVSFPVVVSCPATR